MLYLWRVALFKTQLRGIPRLGYERNIKIIFPMIDDLDEERDTIAASLFALARIWSERLLLYFHLLLLGQYPS